MPSYDSWVNVGFCEWDSLDFVNTILGLFGHSLELTMLVITIFQAKCYVFLGICNVFSIKL